MSDEEGEAFVEVGAQEIMEDYSIWKKHSPFLYDTVITQQLEWPSLTVDWLPGKDCPAHSDFSEQRLILGTHTDGGEQDQLIIATVRLPRKSEATEGGYSHESEKGAGDPRLLSRLENKIERHATITHDGDVNKARHMPQRPSLIATKTPSGEVHIFDVTKSHDSEDDPQPDMRLLGHEEEGFGLDWSPVANGLIASGARDQIVCIWDIQRSSGITTLRPLKQHHSHSAIVGDVAWSSHSPHLLSSVGDDKLLVLYDTRQDRATHTVTAHSNEVNSVDFNKVNEFVLATGSSDCTVALWDLRKLSVQMAQLEHHKDGVFHVHWAPFSGTILASGGSDRRVCIWDISRLGEEQGEEDNEDGPPELLFIHAGHTAPISDLSWNPNDQMVIASVAENNILHIWEMSRSLLTPPCCDPSIDVE